MNTETKTNRRYIPNMEWSKALWEKAHGKSVLYWTVHRPYKEALDVLELITPVVNEAYRDISASVDNSPCVLIYVISTGGLAFTECKPKDMSFLKMLYGNQLEFDNDAIGDLYDMIQDNRERLAAGVEYPMTYEEYCAGKKYSNIQKEEAAAPVEATGKDKSAKNDILDDKLPWELFPITTLEPVVEVYKAGARKYGPNRWQHLENGFERYRAAAMRHLVEYMKGNRYDEDTGCQHLAQFVWNAIAMLNYDMRGLGLIPVDAEGGELFSKIDALHKACKEELLSLQKHFSSESSGGRDSEEKCLLMEEVLADLEKIQHTYEEEDSPALQAVQNPADGRQSENTEG